MADFFGLGGVIPRVDAGLKRWPDWIRRYALAFGALTVATLLAALLLQTIGPKATVLVSVLGDVVFLGAAWLGYGPGISVCFLITFVIQPLLVAGRPVNADLGRFGVLLFVSVLISWTSASKRRTEALLREWGQVLKDRVRERTKAFEASERRYRLLFENNPQPTWVYDQNTLAFLTVNDTAVQGYGYTREEFLRMTLEDIRPVEDIPKLIEATANLSTEFPQEGPSRHRKKNGEIILVEITEHPLTFGEHPACLVMARDITERVRLEEQFRHAQRMESIGRLAGGVAHDFNNLLTVILGYATVVRNGVGSDHRLRKAAEEVLRSGERAASLTAQLLAFSRKQVTQFRVLDLNAFVQETTDMLQRLIGEDIDLVVLLDADSRTVKADCGQLTQVLMNLAANARDAMPTGGKLTIETHTVSRDQEDVGVRGVRSSGRFVQLVVTDTGPGMDAQTQSHVFEPFFTTKEAGKGTGLGLATVYGIVQQHQGWVEVYSEPNHGAAFKVYLPLVDSSSVETTGVEDKLISTRNVSILLVEDEAAIRMLMEDVLSEVGHRVLSAANGPAALKLAEAEDNIDLLITDVVLPDMSGPALAGQLTLLRPGLIVLYVSGYTDHALLHRGTIEQGTAFLQKPFLPQTLLIKVDELLIANHANSLSRGR